MDFACQFCSEEFPSRNKLFVHIRNSHIGNHSHENSDDSANNEYHSSLKILHDDDWVRVVLKPQGLPTIGCEGPTLFNNEILFIKENMKPHIPYRKAMPCHRLDSVTGGIVVCSKSHLAETVIRHCFRHKMVSKRYCAMVPGKLDNLEGIIDEKISGKHAITRYKVVKCTESESYGHVSTLHLWPVTGRTHQLRKHLLHIGHPILGDRRYSHAPSWPSYPPNTLYLWAVEITLPHPKYWQEFAPELEKRTEENEIGNGKQKQPADLDEDEDGEGEEIQDNNTGQSTYSRWYEENKDIPEKFVHIVIDEPPYYERFHQMQLPKHSEHNT